jgi:hypothetical protein
MLYREPVERDLFKIEEAAIHESEAFARASQLKRLVSFLIDAAIAGREVNEYEIATGPLGRSESFDPTSDAIVRKEIRRLRDRLPKFYEREGASRDWQVILPPGPYRVVLRRRLRMHTRETERRGPIRVQHASFEPAGFVDSDGWVSGIADDFLTALVNARGIEVLVPVGNGCGAPADFRMCGSVRRAPEHSYQLRVRLVHPDTGKVEWQGAAEYGGDPVPEQFLGLVERLEAWAANVRQATPEQAAHAA